MGLPQSVRFSEELEIRIKEYLKKNNMKLPKLLELAVEKFISKPQTIILEPADDINAMKTAKESFNEHRDAMDKLK